MDLLAAAFDVDDQAQQAIGHPGIFVKQSGPLPDGYHVARRFGGLQAQAVLVSGLGRTARSAALITIDMDAVPPGSYLALTHSASDLLGTEQRQDLEDVNSRMIQQQFTYRSREQVARFFEGMDLVAPGLVRVEEWRPEPGTAGVGKSHLWCAVARKRDA